MSKNYGVLTEQGYPVGQFGYNPLNEQDTKKIKESEDKNKKTDNKK